MFLLHFSHATGWISAALLLLLLLKTPAKKMRKIRQERGSSLAKSNAANGRNGSAHMTELHKIWGWMMLAAVAAHGVSATLSLFGLDRSLQLIVSALLLGVLCLAAVLAAVFSCEFRRRLKRKWYPLHKKSALILLILTVVHIVLCQILY